MGKLTPVFVASILTATANPCGTSAPQGENITLVGENSLIIYDNETKTEHFVRQASFDGSADTFGFFVPVPTKPIEIATADARIFSYLDGFNPEPPKYRGGPPTGSAGGVQVVSQQQVGDYQASVLKATDGQAISDWLDKNGQVTRPALAKYFDHYTQRAWYIVAFKYTGQHKKQATSAVRISFKTDRPFYPYKRPADDIPKNKVGQAFKLYFISQIEYRAFYETDKPWKSEVKSWISSLGPEQMDLVAEYLSDTTKPKLPDRCVLQVCERSTMPQDFNSDLFFRVTYKF